MITLVQKPDGSFALRDEATGTDAMILGGPKAAAQGAPSYRGMFYIKVPLAALDTAGGILGVVNPLAVDLLVSEVIIDVTTKSTGACTADIGQTPTSITTSSNNLLTALDVGTAAGTFDNITEKGASGKSRVKWTSGTWITASKASGAAAGLVGNAYIGCVIA